jgi:hypothetical protein
MRLKNMKLKKRTEDVGRDGGEKFDTPHRSVSDSNESSGDMSGADSDASSGLGSVDVESACSSTASGSRKKKRTIEHKVTKKIRKLYDLILSCVSDELAMKICRKCGENGLKALAFIEKLFAGKDADRVADLTSDMKDLEPSHFVSFGEYLEAVLQTQSQLEIVGHPIQESESCNDKGVCKGQSTNGF